MLKQKTSHLYSHKNATSCLHREIIKKNIHLNTVFGCPVILIKISANKAVLLLLFFNQALHFSMKTTVLSTVIRTDRPEQTVSVHPDQTLQNVGSDQDIHYLSFIQLFLARQVVKWSCSNFSEIK